MSVKVCNYSELPEWVNREYGVSNNGWGKEYASYLIIDDSLGRRCYDDAMEPEDVRFYRDLKWVGQEIEQYASKLEEAERALGSAELKYDLYVIAANSNVVDLNKDIAQLQQQLAVAKEERDSQQRLAIRGMEQIKAYAKHERDLGAEPFAIENQSLQQQLNAALEQRNQDFKTAQRLEQQLAEARSLAARTVVHKAFCSYLQDGETCSCGKLDAALESSRHD